MKRFKKLGAIALGLVATVSLAACGGNKQADSSSKNDSGDKVVTKVVGVAPGPYGDMATKVISPLLEKKGFKLTTKLFNDYVQPNKALASGTIDADLFQHTAYLEKFASDNHLKLSVVEKVPTLGMGIYSKKLKSLDELQDGATVAIANDASNLARTLQLLAANGLITLKGDIDETKATVDDIATNPKNLTFKTLDAAQLVRSMDNVAIALVPGNFSWAAKLNPADALALEKLKENYKNVFVVQTAEKNSDFAKAVKEVLESQEFKDAIAKSDFKDFDKPAFWSE
ncbi:MetQ/NlpA family ABC transporter substrate-binding protein [Enterococcus camelliae]|uniref:Lipoprotein n=1 Tax=Enterococcus camelliae TaxID=453959 RepID=A0ABW5TL12_9ENTE